MRVHHRQRGIRPHIREAWRPLVVWTGLALGAAGTLPATGTTPAGAAGGRPVQLAAQTAPVPGSTAGQRWAFQKSRNAGGAVSTSLQGVSCYSDTACVAVGSYSRPPGRQFALAEAWNGKRWALVYAPEPHDSKGSYLAGVSCPSDGFCMAVGNFFKGGVETVAFAEKWNGATWSTVRVPQPAGQTPAVFDAVSCTSAESCRAVGTYGNGAGTGVVLAEAWDGTAWTIETTPNPSHASASSLQGVSCTPTRCVAVGYYNTRSGERTLAEVWNGAWSLQSTPDPAGAQSSGLAGASCTSATACTAVGNYLGDGQQHPLVERWDGRTWTIEATRTQMRSMFSSLNAVDCTSDTSCVAVGYRNRTGDGGTLAEHWNGLAWSIHFTPSPSGSLSSSLASVSCASPLRCTAVGDFLDSAGEFTVAERYSPKKG